MMTRFSTLSIVLLWSLLFGHGDSTNDAIIATSEDHESSAVVSRSIVQHPFQNRQRQERNLVDFEWSIELKPQYPLFSFTSESIRSEVVFMYNVAGMNASTFGTDKILTVQVLELDCLTKAQVPAIVPMALSDPAQGSYTVDIDIVQGTIASSEYYTQVNETFASLNFCLRVDYFLKMNNNSFESVNFHETNVTINVDLTSGFTLSTLKVSPVGADQQASSVTAAYPVKAFFCNSTYALQNPPPLISQGQVLQFCVSMDDSVTEKNVYIGDVTTVNLYQPASGEYSATVVNSVPNALTSVQLAQGLARVETVLVSKWFRDSPDGSPPGPLDITGMVSLAFGSPPTSTRRQRSQERAVRYLRVAFDLSHQAMDPARGASSPQRILQEIPSGQFYLKAYLKGPQAQNRVAAVVAPLIALLAILSGCGGYFVLSRRRRKEEKEQKKEMGSDQDDDEEQVVGEGEQDDAMDVAIKGGSKISMTEDETSVSTPSNSMEDTILAAMDTTVGGVSTTMPPSRVEDERDFLDAVDELHSSPAGTMDLDKVDSQVNGDEDLMVSTLEWTDPLPADVLGGRLFDEASSSANRPQVHASSKEQSELLSGKLTDLHLLSPEEVMERIDEAIASIRKSQRSTAGPA
jgi:hypothetical protein